jgi:membrane dipeptidase
MSINPQSLIIAALIMVMSAASSAQEKHEYSRQLMHIHDQLMTIDTHVDIPPSLGLEDADPGKPSPMQYDLLKMEQGKIDGAFFIVYARQGPLSPEGYHSAYDKAVGKFDAIDSMVSRYPEHIALALSPDEFRANLAAGKLSAMIGVENAYSLGANGEHLEEFYDRGARYLSLTHMHNNQFGSSSVRAEDGSEKDTGLNNLGRKMILKMNSLGIMIDVSHTSVRSTLETAQLSLAPLLASHSGAHTLFAHPRNLSDKEIKAIAETGGVIQLVAFDSYLRELPPQNQAASAAIIKDMGVNGPGWYASASQTEVAELRERIWALDAQWPRATVSDFVDHIAHVVNLVGIDHAGIASDFGGGGGVSGWDNASESPAVTKELLNRGYSLEDIQKIWGGNLLRVWEEVEATARKLQAQ